MRISDWNSDLCSSDLAAPRPVRSSIRRKLVSPIQRQLTRKPLARQSHSRKSSSTSRRRPSPPSRTGFWQRARFLTMLRCSSPISTDGCAMVWPMPRSFSFSTAMAPARTSMVSIRRRQHLLLHLQRQMLTWTRRSTRSEEHTSELQSLMRISYAVFCLKKKQKLKRYNTNYIQKYTKRHNDTIYKSTILIKQQSNNNTLNN